MTLQQYMKMRLNDVLENKHLISFYANRKCKDCYGKGVRNLSVSNENTGGQWVDVQQLCPCVKKAIKKEALELEQEDG